MKMRIVALRTYSLSCDPIIEPLRRLGLPCCGLDLLVEHPQTMTALELYHIAGEFVAMHQRVKELPTFNTCQIPKP
jgi:hypothetical protein